MQALWLSIVRTLVPLIVGGVLTWAATAGLELDDKFEGALTAVLYGVLTAAYYVAVRIVEVYVTPKLGWLLGAAKSPDHYSAETVADGTGKHRAEVRAHPEGTHG